MIVLALCLLIFLSLLSACGNNGNSDIGFTGIDHANRSTSLPGETSQTLGLTNGEPIDNRVFEYEFNKTSAGESCLKIGAMSNSDESRYLYIELNRTVEFTRL